MQRKRIMLAAVPLAAMAIFAASGCQYLMGKAAMEVGKSAYRKMKEDREESQREKQRARQAQPASTPDREPPAQQEPSPRE